MSSKKNLGHNSKKDFLNKEVEHIDITSFDSRKIISSMEKMSFVSRETANAANIYNEISPQTLHQTDCLTSRAGNEGPRSLHDHRDSPY